MQRTSSTEGLLAKALCRAFSSGFVDEELSAAVNSVLHSVSYLSLSCTLDAEPASSVVVTVANLLRPGFTYLGYEQETCSGLRKCLEANTIQQFVRPLSSYTDLQQPADMWSCDAFVCIPFGRHPGTGARAVLCAGYANANGMDLRGFASLCDIAAGCSRYINVAAGELLADLEDKPVEEFAGPSGNIGRGSPSAVQQPSSRLHKRTASPLGTSSGRPERCSAPEFRIAPSSSTICGSECDAPQPGMASEVNQVLRSRLHNVRQRRACLRRQVLESQAAARLADITSAVVPGESSPSSVTDSQETLSRMSSWTSQGTSREAVSDSSTWSLQSNVQLEQQANDGREHGEQEPSVCVPLGTNAPLVAGPRECAVQDILQVECVDAGKGSGSTTSSATGVSQWEALPSGDGWCSDLRGVLLSEEGVGVGGKDGSRLLPTDQHQWLLYFGNAKLEHRYRRATALMAYKSYIVATILMLLPIFVKIGVASPFSLWWTRPVMCWLILVVHAAVLALVQCKQRWLKVHSSSWMPDFIMQHALMAWVTVPTVAMQLLSTRKPQELWYPCYLGHVLGLDVLLNSFMVMVPVWLWLPISCITAGVWSPIYAACVTALWPTLSPGVGLALGAAAAVMVFVVVGGGVMYKREVVQRRRLLDADDDFSAVLLSDACL